MLLLLLLLCSGIGSPPHTVGTHFSPLGGFTPFDRIELDIFALIIWQRRRAMVETGGVPARAYTNINNTHTQTLFVYTVFIYTTERTRTYKKKKKPKIIKINKSALYSSVAKYFYTDEKDVKRVRTRGYLYIHLLGSTTKTETCGRTRQLLYSTDIPLRYIRILAGREKNRREMTKERKKKKEYLIVVLSSLVKRFKRDPEQ